MNCKNCGEKVKAFSCYCENCGTKAPPFQGWLKYYWSTTCAFLKKRVWFAAVLAGLVVIAIGLGVWGSLANNLDATDFIITRTYGFNEKGSIYVDVDYEALCEKVLGERPQSDGAKGYEKYVEYRAHMDQIKEAISVSADKTTNLKNGDFYIVTIKILDQEIFKKLGFEVKEKYSKVLQIGKDSPEFDTPIEVNLFDFLNVNFKGDNYFGSVNITQPKTAEILTFASGKIAYMYVDYSESSWYGNFIYVRFPETETVISIELDISPSYGLKNGDTVELSLEGNEVYLLLENGVEIKQLQRTYTVSGLEN